MLEGKVITSKSTHILLITPPKTGMFVCYEGAAKEILALNIFSKSRGPLIVALRMLLSLLWEIIVSCLSLS